MFQILSIILITIGFVLLVIGFIRKEKFVSPPGVVLTLIGILILFISHG